MSNQGGDTVEKTVRDLLGPEQKVVSVHKKPEEVVEEDEVIMVNGNPITLTGKRFKFGLTLILKIAKCTICRSVFPKKSNAFVSLNITSRNRGVSFLRVHVKFL